MADFDPDSLLTAPPPESATMVIRPKKLSPVMEDILNNVIAPGESSGSYNVIYGGKKVDDLSKHPDIPVPITSGPNKGLNSTAAGKYQFINSTWKEAAKALGLHDFGPDSQDAAAAWLAKKTYAAKTGGRDIEADYASGDPSLKAGIRRALASEWESLGKAGPRSEMATVGNDRYRFHEDVFKGDNVHFMSPEDYLALSPPMEDTPAAAKQWRDLRTSVGAGDPIFKAPTLDVVSEGDKATVKAQDGRNRALLAQEAGLDAIPVQINQTGTGTPTEFVGMSGNVVPAHSVAPVASAIGKSLVERALGIGSAQAAEPTQDWGNDPLVSEAAPAQTTASEGDWGNDPLVSTPGALPTAGVMERVGTGMRDVLEGGAQLLRNATPEVIRQPLDRLNTVLGMGSLPTQENIAARERGIEATQGTGFDPYRATGNVLATLPLSRLNPMIAGALSSALQPVTGQNFWQDKAEQTALGGIAGKGGQMLGNALSRLTAPVLRPAAQALANLGVSLTPGQMAGGVLQRAENALASLPVVGSLIRNAEKKGIEDFNTGLINKALEPVGAALPPGIPAGREAIGAAQQIASEAYDRALAGVTFKGDAIMAQEMRDLRSLVAEMPQSHQQQFESIIQNRIMKRMAPTGTMDGQTFKQVESELGFLANGFRASRDMADQQLGSALKQARELGREALERGNPGKRAEIAAANQTYAMLSRIEDASMNRATADGVFTPADLLRSIRANARRTGTRKLFARGDAALQDIAEAGQSVLPQKIPDSGTPERAMWGGLIAGNLLRAPDLAVGGLAALPYTRPGMSAANWLAGPAGTPRNALANAMRTAPQIGAPMLGVAAANQAPQR